MVIMAKFNLFLFSFQQILLIKRFFVGFIPDVNDDKPGGSATQVRPVSYLVAGHAGQPAEQVNAYKDDDGVFCLDGEWNEKKKKLGVGKQVTKGHKQTHDGAGSSYCTDEISHELLCKCRCNTTGKIKEQEPLRPPHIFQYAAKHP